MSDRHTYNDDRNKYSDDRHHKRNKKRNSRSARKAVEYKKRMILLLGCVFVFFAVAVIVKDIQGEEIESDAATPSGPVFNYEDAIRGMTLYDKDEHDISSERAQELMEDYAECYGYSVDAYSEPVKLLLEHHYEAKDFALNYPLHVSRATATDANATEIPQAEVAEKDLSDIDLTAGIPRLFQWDTRWGYHIYGSDAMGITGCGPTALSMVTMYLLQDKKYTPDYIADFAEKEGYVVAGNGTSWDMMYDGATKLGLNVSVLALDENQIAGAVMSGMPVICIMGPGDFTNEGHFIVITGYEGELVDGLYTNGSFIVNDPNCMVRSNMSWEFTRLVNQIGNVWAYSAPEKVPEESADEAGEDAGVTDDPGADGSGEAGENGLE